MDNGTLMLNGTDYSSGKGTLIVNGVIYSGGGSGGGSGSKGQCEQYVHTPLTTATDTFTVEHDGICYAQSCGYMDAQGVLKKNGAVVNPSVEFAVNSKYAFHRHWQFEVATGDVITIYTYSSGQSCSFNTICVI